MDENLPPAISGTRREAKEQRDGTLRIWIDIDPRFKGDFHRLFPEIDMPIALAPLVSDFERRQPAPAREEPKGGPVCRLAAMWCKDEDFRMWFAMRLDYAQDVETEEQAAQAMRDMLQIGSRVQLDHDTEAAGRFHTMIRAPYMAWCRGG